MYIMALNTLVKVYLKMIMMIDFSMTWDELFLTLRNLANLINKRTMSIIHRLEESEKNEQRI